jgi:hypothetical protein
MEEWTLTSPHERNNPLIIQWPVPGNIGGFLSFATLDEWRKFIQSLSLHVGAPYIVEGKFHRAQKLYFLGWIDADIIKAGELIAFTTLELALRDRYLGKLRRDAKFSDLLKHMVEHDGLTDEKIPLIRRCGGSVVKRITGEAKPTFAEIRNSLAHGYPFDGLLYGGLLEVIRDLVDYVYRELAPLPKIN